MDVNNILRRAGYVDSSGAELPISQVGARAMFGGGVYTDQGVGDIASTVLVGRLTLGLIGVLILGAVAFYYWTTSIQGGG